MIVNGWQICKVFILVPLPGRHQLLHAPIQFSSLRMLFLVNKYLVRHRSFSYLIHIPGHYRGFIIFLIAIYPWATSWMDSINNRQCNREKAVKAVALNLIGDFQSRNKKLHPNELWVIIAGLLIASRLISRFYLAFYYKNFLQSTKLWKPARRRMKFLAQS